MNRIIIVVYLLLTEAFQLFRLFIERRLQIQVIAIVAVLVYLEGSVIQLQQPIIPLQKCVITMTSQKAIDIDSELTSHKQTHLQVKGHKKT